MTGKRIAIFGLGRSGLGVGKAALHIGAMPRVYDRQSEEDLGSNEVYAQAREVGLPLFLGWEGKFDRDETDLIVSNPAVDMRHPALVRAVDDGIEVISEVEFAYRISKAPIVAITGTNGKSTTTVMTFLCLRASGEQPILCGNIYGSGYEEMTLTEAALSASPNQTLVAEVSSYQLEWARQFKPVSAGITNIWPDHLVRYTGFDEYAATKQRIFDRMDEDGFAVVKANDPVVVPPGGRTSGYVSRRGRGAVERQSRTPRPTVLTFGATGEHARVEETGIRILNQFVKLEDLPFAEPHNYVNACMAALLAYGLLKHRAKADPESNAARLISDAESKELSRLRAARSVYDGPPRLETHLALPSTVIDGLKAFKGLAHRMELVGERDGIRVINNSMCTNPDAVIKSAQSVRDPAHLLIGGVNKGLDFRPVRHYLANHRHRAYLFGKDAQEIDKMLGGEYPIFDTLNEAFDAATGNAVGGEVIMLAPGCASFDQFSDFRDRGNVFMAIAKEWLRR
ncbi:MAG: UDP-N-acetylmuramoyl-L-alanine--D-glutamate ligase [Fimbriimonas sp.]|nr:UDP-N-acetylmuramoyl-L-alanine--D-glutamate ligase [Fimbriimonas sp.]